MNVIKGAPFSAVTVADAFQKPVSMQSLSKLVYVAHGWHLAYTGVALVRETVVAEDYGIQYRELLKLYKQRRGLEVVGRLGSVEPSPHLKAWANNVQEAYQHLSEEKLLGIVTMNKTPWSKIGRYPAPISDSEIRSYYCKRLGS